jgi:hypothetical protein
MVPSWLGRQSTPNRTVWDKMVRGPANGGVRRRRRPWYDQGIPSRGPREVATPPSACASRARRTLDRRRRASAAWGSEGRAHVRIHLLDRDRRRRDELGRRHFGVVRAYLGARWRGQALRDDLDDAAQEVSGAGRVPGFRALLYGVVRDVARRFQSRPSRAAGPLPDVESNQQSQSRVFERSWARAIMAARLQRRQAQQRGAAAVRRVELLRLRFEEGLPIRAVAGRWGVPAAAAHRAYAPARQQFRAVLLEVTAFHHPGGIAEVEQEAASLRKRQQA